MEELNLQGIRQARERIREQVMYTPLLPVHSHRTPQGQPLLLKAENLQPTGSFKIRGATHMLASLTPEQKARGVIAYSTGNHAQAVALAAKQLGVQATIVMSPDAPSHKIAATERHGAKIVMAESTSEARRVLAERLAEERGMTLVPPYDDYRVMAGQGTIGLEILEQVQPSAVYVPIGGGGLISGIATAVKSLSPEVRVIGVEPEWENDAFLSRQRGHKVTLEKTSVSVADAIRVQTLGELTYPIVERYVDDIVTVTEEALVEATLLAFREMRTVLEPAGAAALAAALQESRMLQAQGPVVVIGSGGNVTLEDLAGWQRAR